ncbi:hypothetical protein L873DRAFT_1786764 [Choiromyces venosus 120613-1]|uniref:Uncharacterized protein n=1 Tax=Choiromyces venosus 120613-1 TaxID=1336337 RepID=A0A3N4JZF4_9PEZI|nr:hypothetical protein L873DRAFT_1786764 [Choiromyces venosus 120613-1]
MPPTLSEKSPESREPWSPDTKQTSIVLELGTNTRGVQYALRELLRQGPKRTQDAESTDSGSFLFYCSEDGDDHSDDKEGEKKKLNVLESSLVLNHMLSKPDKPKHEISIETISEEVGIERSAIVKALKEFTLADDALEDVVSFESLQKEVNRVLAIAHRAEITSWESIAPEGSEEKGVPRLPDDVILELAVGSPWPWLRRIRNETFTTSMKMMYLWNDVEELLEYSNKVSEYCGFLATRDELRYKLIKLGLEQPAANAKNLDPLKIQCFEILNFVCALIEVFIEKISEEAQKQRPGSSGETDGSEVTEDSEGTEGDQEDEVDEMVLIFPMLSV